MTTCSPGSYFNLDDSECYSCSPGYTCSGQGTEPVACIAGWFNPDWEQTSCTMCSPGTCAENSGSPSCAPCDRGKIAPVPGATSCTSCPPGTIGHVVDRTQCVPCGPGTYLPYTPGDATEACLNCPAGTFAPGVNSTECQDCPPNKISEEGAAVCTSCPPNTVSNAAGTACEACPQGTFRTASQGSCEVMGGATLLLVGIDPLPTASRARGALPECRNSRLAYCLPQLHVDPAAGGGAVFTTVSTDTSVPMPFCGPPAPGAGPAATPTVPTMPGGAAAKCKMTYAVAATSGSLGGELASYFNSTVELTPDTSRREIRLRFNDKGCLLTYRVSYGSWADVGVSIFPNGPQGSWRCLPGQPYPVRYLPDTGSECASLSGTDECWAGPVGEIDSPDCPTLLAAIHPGDMTSDGLLIIGKQCGDNPEPGSWCDHVTYFFTHPLPCPAGRYIAPTTLGRSICALCPSGTGGADANALNCRRCRPGSFSWGLGNTACTPCPLGTFADKRGAASCHPCPPGTTTAAVGAKSASDCA